jgi:hypothetical protein
MMDGIKQRGKIGIKRERGRGCVIKEAGDD